MTRILDLSTEKYALYIKQSGFEILNRLLNDLLGPEFTEEGNIKKLTCRGQTIKGVLVSPKDVEKLIEYNTTQLVRFDVCIGRPREREVFEAVVDIRCGDVSFKEKLQQSISARLVALKLASRSPRKRIIARRRPVQLWPAHPHPLREQTT